MKDRKSWSIETKLNHPDVVPLPTGNRPVIAPVYQSAKFTLNPELPYPSQFIYGRISNPTVRSLELQLAEIQRQEDCLALASGAAAITGTLLALLKQGDHVITFRELYKPSRIFIRDFLPRFGVSHDLLSLEDLSDLETKIRPGITKLIHFESPSNPNLSIADVAQILAVARRHGVLVSMDGTFGGLHQHTDFKVDVMIQSLTKYANGHGDVIAGSVSGSMEIIHRIREMAIFLGATLDPQAANLISRGLKTYLLRYERQSKSALAIAEYLFKHPGIRKVYYPGLEDHPRHALALAQMPQAGGVLAFELDESVAPSAEEFCRRTQLIQFAASLGSTESLMCPTQFFFGSDLGTEERKALGINTHSVRLSVGLETVEDIIADLEHALSTPRI